MFKLAKLLHHKAIHNKAIHITFVNTENNHRRAILKSQALNSSASNISVASFHFHTIPNGLPLPSDADAIQDTAYSWTHPRKIAWSPFQLRASIETQRRW
ncbi:UDP-glucuronosyl/UDP-glucosyltransferase [Parasponia andersonii]|uniref:UDP-glucuronosyl/UDP-glucosyltransferase n=1 Tax=Parasponia andersonii TaxID=3476 RepID=A0A2P5BF22_PARAD|nr:UDP-glucuronosyl/UDP-glucosyltransferase [Parasponia andersonii]